MTAMRRLFVLSLLYAALTAACGDGNKPPPMTPDPAEDAGPPASPK
jgi:hypothetical protein